MIIVLCFGDHSGKARIQCSRECLHRAKAGLVLPALKQRHVAHAQPRPECGSDLQDLGISNAKTLQKQLLRLHAFGRRYPNSGALRRLLGELHTKVIEQKLSPDDLEVQVAIATDIAVVSPLTFPAIAGILSHLVSLAQDGHQLALCKSEVEYCLPDLILPQSSVAALRGLLKTADNRSVRIGGAADPVCMQFSGDTWTLFAKCIDGTYPDYARVMPDRSKLRGHAVINRALLRRFPSTTSRSASRQVIAFDLAKRMASLKSLDLGIEVETQIEADGDFSIGFNQGYVREIVQALGTVRIEARGAGDAALVLTEDPNLTVVLMPMRIQ